jgi:hypothetical protein
MTDTGTACCTEIEDPFAGCDENIIQPTQDTCRQFAPERIPDAIFNFSAIDVDGYPLLAIDGLSRDEIFGDQHVILALGDEDARMPMWFEECL